MAAGPAAAGCYLLQWDIGHLGARGLGEPRGGATCFALLSAFPGQALSVFWQGRRTGFQAVTNGAGIRAGDVLEDELTWPCSLRDGAGAPPARGLQPREGRRARGTGG